jgi:hypothetical protein
MAQGARHRTATASTTALACGRRQPLDMYRRRKKARDAAFVRASLDRAESFAAALTRDLARCAVERETMTIIAELTALAVPGTRQAMAERRA